MKRLVLSVLCLSCIAAPSVTAQTRTFGDIRLLEGYKYSHGSGVDALDGTIEKDSGLTIHFESGPSQGYWADPKDKRKYIWYREQVVNGQRVMLGLAEAGVLNPWKPDKPRSRRKIRVLMITFPEPGLNSWAATNFWAEVISDEEIADMILMVLTFNRAKT
jgi:hypothetical protein